MPIVRRRELACPPNAKDHGRFDEMQESRRESLGEGSRRALELKNARHNAEDTDELLCWTPVSDPWRRVRRGALRLVLAGFFALGAWALAQHIPTVSLAAFRSPTVAPVQMPIAHADSEGPPALPAPIVTQSPAIPRGPVVRTIAQ
jgi:hypothetical protein